MRRVIASLDVGSSLIKLVVAEVIKNKINVLACVDTPARGIKKGYVINGESATESFKEVFKKCENVLGIPIKKVIVSVPSLYTDCFLTSGTVGIINTSKVISNTDVISGMKKAIQDKIDDSRVLVNIEPSSFKVNDEFVSNPIGMISEKLTVKAVGVTIPKKNIAGISACLKGIGVEIVDIVISPLADYFENCSNKKGVGAIINIGEETTTVSIFNRGILTNLEVIDIGGDAITNDLSYVYKINKDDAKYVKEHLALAHTRLAQPNESLTFKDKHEEDIKINQYDASEIVMGRIIEIINLAKKQINLLTKKEISYIILTGGVTETQDFDLLIEELLGNMAVISHVDEIGARSNVYSTAIGMIKYYNNKLKLKGEESSMIDESDLEEFGGEEKSNNNSEGSMLGKLFGYFFDN